MRCLAFDLKQKQPQNTVGIGAGVFSPKMNAVAGEGMVIYTVKDGKNRETFDTPRWLSTMCSYVPNRWNRW